MVRSLSRQPTWAVFIEKDKNQEMYIESRQCKCCTKPLFQRLTDTVDDLLHLAAFANRKLVPSSPPLQLKTSFWSPMVAHCIMEEWTLNHFISVSCVDSELLKHLSLFFVVRQISADFQFPKRGRLAIFNFQTSISTSTIPPFLMRARSPTFPVISQTDGRTGRPSIPGQRQLLPPRRAIEANFGKF